MKPFSYISAKWAGSRNPNFTIIQNHPELTTIILVFIPLIPALAPKCLIQPCFREEGELGEVCRPGRPGGRSHATRAEEEQVTHCFATHKCIFQKYSKMMRGHIKHLFL